MDSLKAILDCDPEELMLRAALIRCKYIKTRAAKWLRMPLGKFETKLMKHKILIEHSASKGKHFVS